VTGVQTCALPISGSGRLAVGGRRPGDGEQGRKDGRDKQPSAVWGHRIPHCNATATPASARFTRGGEKPRRATGTHGSIAAGRRKPAGCRRSAAEPIGRGVPSRLVWVT